MTPQQAAQVKSSGGDCPRCGGSEHYYPEAAMIDGKCVMTKGCHCLHCGLEKSQDGTLINRGRPIGEWIGIKSRGADVDRAQALFNMTRRHIHYASLRRALHKRLAWEIDAAKRLYQSSMGNAEYVNNLVAEERDVD